MLPSREIAKAHPMPNDVSSRKNRWTRDLPGLPPDRFSGAGIVICAGGAAMFTNAFVLIHVLRHSLGCRLPIEVWYLGEAELSPRMRGMLGELHVACVDGLSITSNMPLDTIDGWRLKALALAWSSFSKVLLLDADQVPTRDPAEVFDWPDFIRTGAVLWPDVLDIDHENPIWALCGLVGQGRRSIESGQLLIDKERHWRAVQIALRLNEEAHEVYQIIYGDKDTFLLGLLIAGSDFSLIQTGPGIDIRRCFYQHDCNGEILFQHRTGAKWRYSGSQDVLDGFQNEGACAAALETLRRQWNGLIFTPPQRSAAAHAAEKDLCARRDLLFVIAGKEPSVLELLTEGEIGTGRRPDVMNWFCREDDLHMQLVLRDSFEDRWILSREAPGRWVGCSSVDPGMKAYAATGVATTKRPPAQRFHNLWSKWPWTGFYTLPDDGRL